MTPLDTDPEDRRLELDLTARERRWYDRLRARVVPHEPGEGSGLRDLLLLLPDVAILLGRLAPAAASGGETRWAVRELPLLVDPRAEAEIRRQAAQARQSAKKGSRPEMAALHIFSLLSVSLSLRSRLRPAVRRWTA